MASSFDGGGGLDFDELMAVAEHGDAEKGARGIEWCERVTNGLPCRHEVIASVGSHEHTRADDVIQ
jgi:hypothetical protein